MKWALEDRGRIAQIVATAGERFPVALPHRWIEVPDECEEHGWHIEAGAAVRDADAPIEELRDRKADRFRARYQRELRRPIDSDALGSTHAYRITIGDLHNVMLMAILASGGDILCNDKLGGPTSRQERAHTDAQVRQVLADYNANRIALDAHLANKLHQVSEALNKGELDVINW